MPQKTDKMVAKCASLRLLIRIVLLENIYFFGTTCGFAAVHIQKAVAYVL